MRYLAYLFVVTVLCGVASGSDQTVLGRQFLMKDPKPGQDATKRQVIAKATEKLATNVIVGDPLVDGAVLRVFAEGASSSNQVFVLPPELWSATDTGFIYKDRQGASGPVKLAQIRRSAKGTFQIKAAITGKNGVVDVLPPNLGTSGCLRLDLGGGDRYHVLLPGPPDGTIKTNDARKFAVKDARVEGLCPRTPVCGNGVREPGEECDGGPACSGTCVQQIPACCSAPMECSDVFTVLDTTLVGLCGPRTPIRGGVCAADGSCATHTIDPVPICCQLRFEDGCYQGTVASTADLWLFQNQCVGARISTMTVAANCVANRCIPEQ